MPLNQLRHVALKLRERWQHDASALRCLAMLCLYRIHIEDRIGKVALAVHVAAPITTLK